MKFLRLLSTFAIISAFCSCGEKPASQNADKPAEKPSASAESSTPAPAGTWTVGFSQIGAESGWRTAETESIKGEAAQRNIPLKFSDAQGKQENQIKALRSFLAQGVNAIILAPVVETGWEPVLKEIKQANIPVILVDRGIKVNDDSLYTTMIASDFVVEGRMAAEWLGGKLNGKGNIVELQGTPGASAAIDRKKGFEEGLAKFPEMKIIKSQTGDFTRAGGKQVMEAFLKAEGKNINALYAHNDDMALGATQAIEEAGLKPGTDIIIVSIDGIKPIFEAIAGGKANCTVECNPLLGPTVFETLDAIRAGDKPEKKIVMKDDLYDETTAEKVLPTRKY
jgi:ABC-type sugar transport system substrate-binding protein